MKTLLRAALVYCAGAAGIAAEETPKSALLVLNKGDTSLAIVDPVSLKVVARIPSGPDPHEVEVTPDGRTAIITNYQTGNALTVIDLVGQKVLSTVNLGALRAPHGLWMATDGKAYFTAENSNVIGRYDPASQQVDWVLGLGQQRTHMVIVSKDVRKIFTTNMNSNSITILEQPAPAAGRGGRGGAPTWMATHITVGGGPEGFDLSPDEKEIWAANSRDGTISVIDVATKAVTATLNIPTQQANRLKFSRDGKLALVSALGGEIVIVDVATRKEVKRFPVGRSAAGALMHPDGSKAYVSVGAANRVEIVDLQKLEIVGNISTGPTPDGLAWAERK